MSAALHPWQHPAERHRVLRTELARRWRSPDAQRSNEDGKTNKVKIFSNDFESLSF
jgi:hypothetical protein